MRMLCPASKAFPHRCVCITRVPSHLSPMFADQLNATGFSQLQSMKLAPEEEADNEELEDYY